MTDDTTLEALVAAGETDRLELKKSLAEIDNALRTAAAFASQEGGAVVFGVAPSGSVVGLGVGADTIEKLVQALRNRIDPKMAPVVRTASLNGRTVIVVEVAGTRQPHLADGRFFKRVGNATVQATRDEYRTALLREVHGGPATPQEAARDALRRASDPAVPATALALEAIAVARQLEHPAQDWLRQEVAGYPQRGEADPNGEDLPHYRKLQVYASKVFPKQLGRWTSLAVAISARPDLFVQQFLLDTRGLGPIEAQLAEGGLDQFWVPVAEE